MASVSTDAYGQVDPLNAGETKHGDCGRLRVGSSRRPAGAVA
jgi:hypothetical protein